MFDSYKAKSGEFWPPKTSSSQCRNDFSLSMHALQPISILLKRDDQEHKPASPSEEKLLSEVSPLRPFLLQQTVIIAEI